MNSGTNNSVHRTGDWIWNRSGFVGPHSTEHMKLAHKEWTPHTEGNPSRNWPACTRYRRARANDQCTFTAGCESGSVAVWMGETRPTCGLWVWGITDRKSDPVVRVLCPGVRRSTYGIGVCLAAISVSALQPSWVLIFYINILLTKFSFNRTLLH